jgi:asparagine synthase (glutamine-hydrolysing)
MSSVIAILNRSGNDAIPEIAVDMLNARPERGPDGFAIWFGGPVAVGHRRLVLLPEERSERQPLVDDEFVLAADIRLDNRREIADQLKLTPGELALYSDASLLLASYRCWGEDCLSHLLGAFAFVLWDARRQQLFAGRDPLGERGLCYYLDEDVCVVASEIANLLAHPAVVPRINDNRIAAFLALIWDNGAETYYQNIFTVPPGYGLTVAAHSDRRWCYWTFEPGRSIRYRRESEYADHYLELLKESLRCRLRSVGPIGISLSGGLDSTAIAALAAPMIHSQAEAAGLKGFSYAFDELIECDERIYIEPLVERYQILPHYLICDNKWPLKNLDEWPLSPDLVLADPFASLPASVMKAAGESGIRLLLAGYFGDTLFGGSAYWALDMFRHRKIGLLAQTTYANRSSINWRDAYIDYGARRLMPGALRQAYRQWRPRSTDVLAPGISQTLVRRTNLREKLSPKHPPNGDWSPGLWERYQGLSPDIHGHGHAAVRYQYNSHGMERLDPYYDRRLVEFVMAVPAYILGGPDFDRRLHRQAMKGILPEEIRLRRSRTVFTSLSLRGLQEREWEKIKGILSRPQVVERDYIDAGWLQHRLEVGFDRTAESMMLWRALCIELWLQRYWI